MTELIQHGPIDETSERDSCGLAAVINLNQDITKDTIDQILSALCDLDLRGAKLEDTGDGAGIMLRTKGLRDFLEPHLPAGTKAAQNEDLHIGQFFVSKYDALNLDVTKAQISDLLQREGVHTFGWRKLMVDDSALGRRARELTPIPLQLTFSRGFHHSDENLTLALYRAKLAISSTMRSVDVVSLEAGTATYKAMSTGDQLRKFYNDDFSNPNFKTDAAFSHTRFATNVLSRFGLAQPFGMLCHNGEINTIAALRAATRDLEMSLRLRDSVLMRGGSDSGDLDRMLQLFHSHGVPLSESLRRIFKSNNAKDKLYNRAVRRALGPLSAAEGPAAVLAMDDKEIVAILDGLGLRPLRAIETDDGLLILTSEIGAPFIDLQKIRRTFQLDAGEMLIVRDGKIYYPNDADDLVLAGSVLNYKELGQIHKFPNAFSKATSDGKERLTESQVRASWNLFGGNTDILNLVKAMAKLGKEPVLGMGNDQPLAVFSKSHPKLANHFHQTVAVVTNPPMDHIREGAAMDLNTYIGKRPRANIHGHEYKEQPFVELEHPILNDNLLQGIEETEGLLVKTFNTACESNGGDGIRERIEEIKREAVRSVRNKTCNVIILSDRNIQEGQIYIPPVLIAGAIHNELSKFGLRRHASIICDTGEAFEAHDMALLLAMGADAVNPYLLWQACESGLISNGSDSHSSTANLMQTHVATLKRIMSKMGITSIEGYRGSKLMHAVGVDPLLVQFYLGCPVAQIGGINLEDIARGIKERSKEKSSIRRSDDSGAYDQKIRKALEAVHWSNPANPYEAFLAFTKLVEEQNPVYIRDLLKINPDTGDSIPLDRVMTNAELFRDHIRGSAMSHGALQLYAHRAISGAFNELGGMANSGEGGELKERNIGGKWEKDRSKIRQRASAMFGLDAEYLINAEEIEIKVGQGAKPGEGGHLPGYKVGPIIAKMRNTQTGIDLISPPPLHDVYSIEDLARLIQDLRAVNPRARIAVKITANTDIGTVAVGIAKAGADVIGVSGYEGGTGAASSSSIEHTGLPLEISLAEIHQALVRNGIRDIVKIRADGGIKTGEDIIKLACLGSDEFGLGTALLVAGERCIFCNSCSGQAHGFKPGTFPECPTGITSLTPKGAKKLGHGARKVSEENLFDNEKSYEVSKEAIKHYLELLAENIRYTLAALGKKNIDEIVGDTTLLNQIPRSREADRLVLAELLKDLRSDVLAKRAESMAMKIDRVLTKPAINEANQLLIDEVKKQNGNDEIRVSMLLSTKDRTFGATLAGKIASGEIKIPPQGIRINTSGFAGQSLGFCNVKGVTIDHEGFANDFVSYGQSDGKTIVRQPKGKYRTQNSIVGNASAYGASGGKVFAAGRAGQRYGVKNCGATLVSEGTGIFPYEYMTGGLGIDLDKVGNEVGSGMSDGKLFLRDEDGTLHERLHSDVMITTFTEKDKELLRATLQEYCNDTNSPLARKILADFDKEFKNFKRVVPKDYFTNLLTKVLTYDFYRVDDSISFDAVVEEAALELKMDKSKITDLLKAFEQDDKVQKLEAPYRFQAAKELARAHLTDMAKLARNS